MEGSFVRFLPRHSNSGCRVCHLAEAALGIQGVDAKSIVVVRFRRTAAYGRSRGVWVKMPLSDLCRGQRRSAGLLVVPFGSPDGDHCIWDLERLIECPRKIQMSVFLQFRSVSGTLFWVGRRAGAEPPA